MNPAVFGREGVLGSWAGGVSWKGSFSHARNFGSSPQLESQRMKALKPINLHYGIFLGEEKADLGKRE